ncbi:DUF1129 family protein [Lactobacillus sp. S2-2]|uniref:DUF1129 family protein n=1 Tax=Lactobacillus sp. S2-2 TaxID=2692917 RepID=UPI001F1E4359|nr:DUF1129 family protein [Lactobacillus sp. S2-2]MCF6515206.1 DUF1129 family protein [Lactobacillus sp. S2-2]
MADNQKRNANKQQNHVSGAQVVHSEFNDLGLTKRNAEYMFKFKQALGNTKLDAEKQKTTIDEMVETLIEEQKKGQTARNLFGTVDEKIQNIVNPPQKQAPWSKKLYFLTAGYNFLWIFSILSIMYAITYYFASAQTKDGGALGALATILIAVVVGLSMPMMTRLFAPNVKHNLSVLMRILLMVGVFLGWMLIFTLVAMIPHSIINPVNPFVYMVFGVLGIAGILFMRSKYTIRNGSFYTN